MIACVRAGAAHLPLCKHHPEKYAERKRMHLRREIHSQKSTNQKGLEPPTHGSGNRCSIQLSYWSTTSLKCPSYIILHLRMKCKKKITRKVNGRIVTLRPHSKFLLLYRIRSVFRVGLCRVDLCLLGSPILKEIGRHLREERVGKDILLLLFPPAHLRLQLAKLRL